MVHSLRGSVLILWMIYLLVLMMLPKRYVSGVYKNAYRNPSKVDKHTLLTFSTSVDIAALFNPFRNNLLQHNYSL